VLGAGTYRDYVRDVLPEIDWFRVSWNNSSLLGFWSRLFDPAPERVRPTSRTEPLWQSPALARAGACVSDAVVVALLAMAVRRARTRAEDDIAFGLTATAMVLVAPVAWEHYFLLLLVPLAVTWVHLPPSWIARAAFLAVVFALGLSPALVWTACGVGGRVATPLDSLGVLSFQCYALLGLFALGLAELSRSRDLSGAATTPPGAT
jgi:hypothetical protein